jgi:hypothetical protein
MAVAGILNRKPLGFACSVERDWLNLSRKNPNAKLNTFV